MFVRILLQKHPQNTQKSDGTPNFGHICFKKLNSLWILRMSRMIKRLGRIQQRFTSHRPLREKKPNVIEKHEKKKTPFRQTHLKSRCRFFKWPSPNSGGFLWPQPNAMGNVPALMVPHVARCAPVTMWGWSWKAPSSGRRVLQGAGGASSALQVHRLTPKIRFHPQGWEGMLSNCPTSRLLINVWNRGNGNFAALLGLRWGEYSSIFTQKYSTGFHSFLWSGFFLLGKSWKVTVEQSTKTDPFQVFGTCFYG